MRPACIAALLLLAGCSRSNNLLLGRVEAKVGNHDVVVTDCYRTSVPPPAKLSATEYSFAPCRDAVVFIRSDELIVNGKSYGRMQPTDAIIVDHGVVSINGRQ